MSARFPDGGDGLSLRPKAPGGHILDQSITSDFDVEDVSDQKPIIDDQGIERVIIFFFMVFDHPFFFEGVLNGQPRPSKKKEEE